MAQADPTNWGDVAAKIVNRMALVRGERVLLVGLPDAAGPLVWLSNAWLSNGRAHPVPSPGKEDTELCTG